jgi:hypothetical protein
VCCSIGGGFWNARGFLLGDGAFANRPPGGCKEVSMSHEMELEDYYSQCKAECAALREQVDNMVALLCAKDREIFNLQDLQSRTLDRLNRMTLAMDEALAIVRVYQAERREDMEGHEL